MLTHFLLGWAYKSNFSPAEWYYKCINLTRVGQIFQCFLCEYELPVWHSGDLRFSKDKFSWTLVGCSDNSGGCSWFNEGCADHWWPVAITIITYLTSGWFYTDHVRGYLIDFDMFYTHATQCTHCNAPTLGQKWLSFCPNGVPCVFNGEPDWTLWALLLTLVSTCYGGDKTQSM